MSFSISTNTSAVGDVVAEDVGEPGRQQEEEADREQQREGDRARPGAAAQLLLLALLVRRDLGVGRDAERLEADLERLGQGHHAAHDREAQQPVALGPGDERLGGDLDLALGALLGVGAARARAAPRRACARPPPRWRRRASSRPRARPGRRSGRPSWPPAPGAGRGAVGGREKRSPHSSYRRAAVLSPRADQRGWRSWQASWCVLSSSTVSAISAVGIDLRLHPVLAVRARGWSRPSTPFA